jgi:hypothetical protein
MPILNTGQTFGAKEQVTSTKLENIADLASFASGAVDGSTTELTTGATPNHRRNPRHLRQGLRHYHSKACQLWCYHGKNC